MEYIQLVLSQKDIVDALAEKYNIPLDAFISYTNVEHECNVDDLDFDCACPIGEIAFAWLR